MVPDNSIVFCDPPYRRTTFTYGERFSDQNQRELLEWCSAVAKRSKVSVIQTNQTDGHFFEALCATQPNIITDYYAAYHSNNVVKRTGKDIVMVWNSLAPHNRHAVAGASLAPFGVANEGGVADADTRHMGNSSLNVLAPVQPSPNNHPQQEMTIK